MVDIERLVRDFNPEHGFTEPDSVTERRLHDLSGVFADTAAYEAACLAGNPLVYSVQIFTPGGGEGDLHVGYGTIEPGTVGSEFFMTKGHVHERAEMAEVYIGLRGKGYMLLQDVRDGGNRAVELGEGRIVYVPGHTAHRTVNSGSGRLAYFGIYSAAAGHDYRRIAEDDFDAVVLRGAAGPRLVPRREVRDMKS
jgi:glucose-6-phosphate isomerase